MPPSIDAIFFDLGRVLASFNFFLPCARLARLSRRGLHPDDILRILWAHESPLRGYDRGEFGEDVFFEQMKKVLHINGGLTQAEFAMCWGNIFTENTAIHRLCERIPDDIRRYIVSNTEPTHWACARNLPVVRKYFPQTEQHVLSFAVRSLKPEAAIYNEAIARSDTPIKNVLYIDDTPQYVEAFRRLGGNAEVYDCVKDPIGKLEAELSRYGVIS